jgi:hypothetical protein
MKKLILLLSLIFAGNAFPVGLIRYVDSSVATSGNGLTWGTAWKGLDNITGVGAGDTVYVSGGTTTKTYNDSDGWNPPNGTSSSPFTLAIGIDAGHTGIAIFNGTNANQSYWVNRRDVQWVTVNGRLSGTNHFRVQNYWNIYLNPHDGPLSDGLKLLGITTPLTIYARSNDHMEMGWITFELIDDTNGDTNPKVVGPHVQASQPSGYGRNSIHDCEFNMYYIRGVDSNGNNGNDGIKEPASCDIYNNRFVTTLWTGGGIVGGDHQDGIQTADDADLRIYNNYFENLANYMIYWEFFSGGTKQNMIVYNNVFNYSDASLTAQPTQALAFGAHNSSATFANVLVANNTFRGGQQAASIGDTNGTLASSVRVVNNIRGPAAGQLNLNGNSSAATSTNNPQMTGTGNYADVNSGNFRLTASATAAIDQGINPSPSYLTNVFTTDADGATRTNPWDAGAYEFGAGGSDTVAPTLTGATIASSGTTMTRTFSEPVNTSLADDGSWSMLSSVGGALSSSYASGSGSATINYNLSRTVNSPEVVTNTYSGTGVKDLANNSLANISTPQSVANGSAQGTVAAPTFSPNGGTYFGTRNVVIDSVTTGSTIYYTTDGSTPDTGSQTYVNPVVVSSNATIRAFGVKSGFADSAVMSASYELSSWSTTPSQWKTFTVPSQTASFPWNFRASVSSATSNTVIGLGPIPATQYGDMSVIVRFNDTGTIDVHNNANGNYTADAVVPYTAGTKYTFAVSVNMTASPKVFSVTVTPAGGSSTAIASNYLFRASQANPSSLSSMGMFTVAGTATVDQMTIGTDLTAPLPNPSTFSSNPSAVDSFSVTMTATTAVDDFNNPPDYFFQETTGHAGATSSGWIRTPTYTDSGLSPSTSYSYFVWTRDQNFNQGSASATLSATTPATPVGGTVNCNTLNVTTLRVGP